MSHHAYPPSFERISTPRIRISGKNGNAARLLAPTDLAATATRSAEAAATSATPHSGNNPATPQAKIGNVSGNIGNDFGKKRQSHNTTFSPLSPNSSQFPQRQHFGKISGNVPATFRQPLRQQSPTRPLTGTSPTQPQPAQAGFAARSAFRRGFNRRLAHPPSTSATSPARFRQDFGNKSGNIRSLDRCPLYGVPCT